MVVTASERFTTEAVRLDNVRLGPASAWPEPPSLPGVGEAAPSLPAAVAGLPPSREPRHEDVGPSPTTA